MINKLIKSFLLFALMINIASCVVRTPYDRQYVHRSRPTSLMSRPRFVNSDGHYPFVWNPFGGSSNHYREHWHHYHGLRRNRVHLWPQKFIPHPHGYKMKYIRKHTLR